MAELAFERKIRLMRFIRLTTSGLSLGAATCGVGLRVGGACPTPSPYGAAATGARGPYGATGRLGLRTRRPPTTP
ncbi:hypothetical protein GCM10009562_10820 [Nocardioides aquaticus]